MEYISFMERREKGLDLPTLTNTITAAGGGGLRRIIVNCEWLYCGRDNDDELIVTVGVGFLRNSRWLMVRTIIHIDNDNGTSAAYCLANFKRKRSDIHRGKMCLKEFSVKNTKTRVNIRPFSFKRGLI
ncbi:hypothetical protein FRACYDRAFT_252607 [Fragilariopsis cylindrus CCMP1102]|uniref:Uncharacterized protein n=1 Tax=Fragilariopsis cylindrus CCMP1102 TaxID=635003 RepID=A0A1E7EM52_9STRA|nr:hypothetical protein FRACYDRAFT_252607 [Fragilariopsis cylindrus CCMP1102]|eukprot:OEU06975.1 hypothetical protein FRACYDRAFT_252607 [Fragilariopsis cylindrus CCMP1102]